MQIRLFQVHPKREVFVLLWEAWNGNYISRIHKVTSGNNSSYFKGCDKYASEKTQKDEVYRFSAMKFFHDLMTLVTHAEK